MNTQIRYRNRIIDLKPYFEGFPFMGFYISEKDNRIYYRRKGAVIQMYQAPLEYHPDLNAGSKVSDLDFNKFTAWRFEYHAPTRSLLYAGDERNDEQMNLFFLNTETGERTRLTDEDYIYGAGLFGEDRYVGFIARANGTDRKVSTFKVLDITTGEITPYVSDTPEWTFIWTPVLHDPDTDTFFWEVTQEYDRNRHNIMMFHRPTGTTEILLPKDVKRSTFGFSSEWLAPGTLMVFSDEDGYENLYSFHLPSRTLTQLTKWTDPVGSARVFNYENRTLILGTQQNPVNDTLFILDPDSGKVIWKDQPGGRTWIQTAKTKRLFTGHSSHSCPMEVTELVLSGDPAALHVDTRVVLKYPDPLLKQLVHGRAEAVRYPTFDTDPATGTTRMIHAYLLVPDNLPARPENRRAVITAFYGGDNMFCTDYQVFLDAGFIVLSPAVRGSWGFGAEFYSLNDRDLGGNEIIDLIYAGRYLTQRFGLAENQVGLQGGSHGGYCAMRGLTFPESVNGHREHFDWGFAVSSYGISNIIDYYHTCNIPDWVLQKAGDPATEQEKLMDRSPIRHAACATGPLLLVHGVNDSRVPVDQSRQMARAMADAGKPYTLVEIPDQGHGWQGLAENLRYYREVFKFMESLD